MYAASTTWPAVPAALVTFGNSGHADAAGAPAPRSGSRTPSSRRGGRRRSSRAARCGRRVSNRSPPDPAGGQWSTPPRRWSPDRQPGNQGQRSGGPGKSRGKGWKSRGASTYRDRRSGGARSGRKRRPCRAGRAAGGWRAGRRRSRGARPAGRAGRPNRRSTGRRRGRRDGRWGTGGGPNGSCSPRGPRGGPRGSGSAVLLSLRRPSAPRATRGEGGWSACRSGRRTSPLPSRPPYVARAGLRSRRGTRGPGAPRLGRRTVRREDGRRRPPSRFTPVRTPGGRRRFGAEVSPDGVDHSTAGGRSIGQVGRHPYAARAEGSDRRRAAEGRAPERECAWAGPR